MPDPDQTPEGCRRWRLFSRALVVAGVTVAGTSAVWLVGAAASADAADSAARLEGPTLNGIGAAVRSAAESPLVEGVRSVGNAGPAASTGTAAPVENDLAQGGSPESGAHEPGPVEAEATASHSAESDPAAFSLGDLDPTALRAEPFAAHGPEPGPVEVVPAELGDALDQVGGVVRPPAREVGAVVADAGGQVAQLGTVVHKGLDEVGRPLGQGPANAPVDAGALPGVVDPPHVDGTHYVSPAAAPAAAPKTAAGQRSPVRSLADSPAGQPESANASRPDPAGGDGPAPRHPGDSPFPVTTGLQGNSAAAGCAGPAEGKGPAGMGSYGHFPESGKDDSAALVRAGRGARTVVGIPAAQPGTTPD